MHEWSIAQSLRRMVEERARAQGADRVVAVHVRIGDVSGVVAELLATAWEGVRRDGLTDGATLHVTRVPGTWVCALCREPIGTGEVLRCATCDLPAVLAGGDELLLERIELELP